MPVSQIAMGSSDLHLSRIIPGLMRLMQWNLSPQELLGWINTCLDMGITSFDHADIYGSYRCEAAFGDALALDPAIRDRIQIVTKCGIALVSSNRPAHTVHHYNTTKAHILTSVENSLRNFQTDRIDLLLIHRPDPLMDADEVAAAIHTLRQEGKVLHFGVSNFMPMHFDLLQSRLGIPLVTNQIEFSVSHMEPFYDGTLDQAQRLRTPPMAWSPVGGGDLFTSNDEKSVRLRAALEKVAKAHGDVPLDTVAIAWILKHPANVIPVLGTGKLERIRTAAAAEDITLEHQEWFSIWEASAGHEVP
jgi:predicted oxidoreductase